MKIALKIILTEQNKTLQLEKFVLVIIVIVITTISCTWVIFNTIVNNKSFLDSDNDGIVDSEDVFPYDSSEQKDSDGDGVGDNTDKFPYNPNEWEDSDGDGTGDNSDVFPTNPDEWSDFDGDGVGGNSDKNPLVDLSINITLEKFKVTGRVDILRWAQVYFDINVNDGEKVKRVNNNGENWMVWLGKEEELNYVFSYDISDDTDKD